MDFDFLNVCDVLKFYYSYLWFLCFNNFDIGSVMALEYYPFDLVCDDPVLLVLPNECGQI